MTSHHAPLQDTEKSQRVDTESEPMTWFGLKELMFGRMPVINISHVPSPRPCA